VIQDRTLVKNYLKLAFDYLESSGKDGVHSANYYLGMMYKKGIFVHKDNAKAFNHFVDGAAENNAMCLYNLAIMYLYGDGLDKNEYLHFKYLKRSAEEGFVSAQHMLGIAYFEGRFIPKDDKLALAWFREAARNGHPLSLINAGDLLTYGSKIMDKILSTYDPKAVEMVHGIYSNHKSNLKPNLLFAMSQYISAYRYGATFLQPRMQIIADHLRESGDFRKD
jgi:TPR repeat protein